ncbi:unnamed protein product [Acanthoscelides obtectus]|uniref:Uncharacterized protein n=1 Tax=Acanthoscelides obtectus TaxID=200917 RepID=A0A9P0L9T4_ACAOB|nr:unnamed protein product [Acanthoscelides obtectus]CAK1641814.1 hypothetical protein AOBTE_LOCUS12651 [Acanthoscelides obtectus]
MFGQRQLMASVIRIRDQLIIRNTSDNVTKAPQKLPRVCESSSQADLQLFLAKARTANYRHTAILACFRGLR